MPNTLDVEFLLNPAQLTRSIVYRFRSGALRRNMMRALEERSPTSLHGCEPSQLSTFIRGSGLFDLTAFCDLSSKNHQSSSFDVANILFALSDSSHSAVIVFAHHRHPIFRHDNWNAASANCVVLEEEVVTEETLEAVLSYLEHASDLIRVRRSDASLARLQYFREKMRDERSVSFADFQQEFDSAVLLYANRATGEFYPPLESDDYSPKRTSLFRAVRDLLEGRGASGLSPYLRAIAELDHRGYTARDLADELCMVTRRVLEAQTPGRDETKRRVQDALRFELNGLIWAAALLTWTVQLIRNSDNEEKEQPGVRLSLILLDQFAREFLLRSDAQEVSDPLAGLWNQLEVVIAPTFDIEFEATNPRNRLVTSLSSFLPASASGDRPWIARLRHTLAEPIGRISQPQQSPADPLVEWSPKSFDQIYGNAVTLRNFHARFAAESHATPLLLYGPTGVGKHAIAQVYARTLLCERREPETWLACGKCETCRSLDTAGDIGLIQFDAAKDESGETAKEVLSRLRNGLYHRHRVIIIENPERSERSADVFLKTLEEGIPETTFILCVSDLKAMSATGNSRCTIHRVRPLEASDSVSLAVALLRRLDAKVPDVEGLALIAAEADGFPGELRRICNNVAATGAVLFDDLSIALELDWVGSIITYWEALVNPQRPSLDKLALSPAVDPNTIVGQVRQVLSALHPTRAVTGSTEVVINRGFGQRRNKIIAMLRENARKLAVPYEELWSELMRLWASSDHADAKAFLEAGLVSWQIAHGATRTGR